MWRTLTAAAAISIVCTTAEAPARTWTSSSGAIQIEAELMEKRADGTILLKRTDGVKVEAKVEKLSAADQEYIRQWKPPAVAKPGDDSKPGAGDTQAGSIFRPEEKAALDKVKTPGAKAVVQEYEKREKELHDTYTIKQKEYREKLAVLLEEALKDATTAGNLDEAVLIRDSIKALRAGQDPATPQAVAPARGEEEAKPKNRKKPPHRAVLFEGHHYLLYQDAMTWANAAAACKKEGGHLVRVDNQEEFNFLAKLMNGVPRRTPWVWADLRDEAEENNWVDSDGKKPGFLDWKSGEPSAGDRSTNCGCADSRDPSGFLDHPCNSPSSFICEWDY